MDNKLPLEIENLVYTSDDDRRYLSPDSEDYKITVYEYPSIFLYDYRVTSDQHGAPVSFRMYGVDETEKKTSARLTNVES
ncbi:MAG: hypothetical protein K6G57_03805, partial [Lachnospiraceae bacterium]|nr:hypothetical protein [Lachnospiraceae bacterium]